MVGLRLSRAPARWRYFAVPLLHEGCIDGRADAAADPQGGALVIIATHEDVPLTDALRAGLDAEIDGPGAWLGPAAPTASSGPDRVGSTMEPHPLLSRCA